jgi:hypothetical protein
MKRNAIDVSSNQYIQIVVANHHNFSLFFFFHNLTLTQFFHSRVHTLLNYLNFSLILPYKMYCNWMSSLVTLSIFLATATLLLGSVSAIPLTRGTPIPDQTVDARQTMNMTINSTEYFSSTRGAQIFLNASYANGSALPSWLTFTPFFRLAMNEYARINRTTKTEPTIDLHFDKSRQRAYVLTPNHFTTWDTSALGVSPGSSQSMTLLGTWLAPKVGWMPGWLSNMFVDDASQRAFVCDVNNNAIWILDLTNDSAPTNIGMFNNSQYGRVKDVVTQGNYMFVLSEDRGPQIIVFNNTAPTPSPPPTLEPTTAPANATTRPPIPPPAPPGPSFLSQPYLRAFDIGVSIVTPPLAGTYVVPNDTEARSVNSMILHDNVIFFRAAPSSSLIGVFIEDATNMVREE